MLAALCLTLVACGEGEELDASRDRGDLAAIDEADFCREVQRTWCEIMWVCAPDRPEGMTVERCIDERYDDKCLDPVAAVEAGRQIYDNSGIDECFYCLDAFAASETGGPPNGCSGSDPDVCFEGGTDLVTGQDHPCREMMTPAVEIGGECEGREDCIGDAVDERDVSCSEGVCVEN